MGVLPTTMRRCPVCEADEESGEARTVSVGATSLVVTWHLSRCPHYRADRILAGRDT